jgi:hypothetical protein
MKRLKVLNLLIIIILIRVSDLNAQIGYYDAPYVRYEADLGTLTNGAAATSKSFNQSLLQSEASNQVCVNMSSSSATVAWTVTVAGDGLVVRYSVPDGQSASVDVYSGATFMGNLNLTTNWSWEYLSSNGNPNNVGVVNTNPKMRFDEVRLKLSSKIPVGGTLKLVRVSGNVHIDFAELEPVPAAVTAAGGDVTYDGSGLQNFINNNGGKVIYLPAGYYNCGSDLFFGNNNTTLKGAGMWYTQINFTSGTANDGGLWGQATNISYSGLYLTTDRNSRSNSYKALNGVYTSGSTITNVWAEHFECGAWIAQYGAGPGIADGFTMSNCRFRNNYADGTNLCKGTSNAIVEHCNYRNNGDDDMAIWPANNQTCDNNTFRYNTSENCWRASGCAIYGGTSNQAHHLLIRDNVEVGLRVGNNFGGSPFNTGGMHQFYNIRIERCGTYNDLFNQPVGAIDILGTNIAGSTIYNVKFSCIEIIDSKNDAIDIYKKSGNGFNNFVFENITIDGTGAEYPDNGGAVGGRGYGLLFKGSPSGSGTYCNMTYANRGGSATSDVNTAQIGSFSWTAAGSCPGGCTALVSATVITSASSFGICNAPITLTATTSAPSGNTVNYVEFFVDGVSKGTDNTSSYSVNWSNPTPGSHTITATAHYSPSNTTSSASQTITVIDGIYSTSTPPTIDGTIEASWNGYTASSLTKGFNSSPDLAASFKTRYDATYLYVLVDVTDDALWNDAGNNWDNDGVELFIDMGNDKSGAYGANDFQYAFNYHSTTPTFTEYKHTATTGVTFAQGIKAGGYIFEIRIPWSTLGGAPTAGTFMGFDVGINDDDNGGVRENQLSWNDPTFTEYNSTALLGTLQIANCSNPLPVELFSFTAEKNNESVILNWTSVSERNNKKYIIERSSDLNDWKAIGEVEGAGNSSTVAEYNFIDHSPLNGISYYRLRQVDIDGTVAYSNAVTIQSGSNSTSIAPNPFEESFVVYCDFRGNVNLRIFDMMGRIVYDVKKECSDGTMNIQPQLSSGTYLVTIQSDTFMDQQKIIKK